MSSSDVNLEYYIIPLGEINRATENFSQQRCIGGGGFGSVYRGQLSERWGNHTVAVKRLGHDSYQGDHEFRNEVEIISRCDHENIISFIGYCDEDNEKIIVYDYAMNTSLDHHLRYPNKMCLITWTQRLEICIGAARGLNYLHSGFGEHNRVIHRDVKSANILLHKNFVAKICDFGLSKLGPKNQPNTELLTKVAGTRFYMDPVYNETRILRKESDVYSFGVVLFEILSGRLAYSERTTENNGSEILMTSVRRHSRNALVNLIDPNIRLQIHDSSFYRFKEIAYQCISFYDFDRPTMETVVEKLEEALKIQDMQDKHEGIMVGKGFAPAIGIDLGTTYSCVAVWQHDQVHIIPNDQGNRTLPSCVAFTAHGRLIGEGAKNQIHVNPANTIYDAKRLIGRRFSDSKLQEDMKLWPFKVIKGTNDIPKILVAYKGEKKGFSAEEISSMVLRKLKDNAEAYLGKIVHDAVITVPAYFDNIQCQATKNAALIAGLNVLQIINEPTSAVIAYGLDVGTDATHVTHVLVFNMGVTTLDVSFLTVHKKGVITVKAVTGDTHIGGQDFDNNMVDHFVSEFNRTHNTNMRENREAMGRLRVACEKAKQVLCSTTNYTIYIDCLHQGIDFSMRITREKFQDLNANIFTKCIQMVESCLVDAKMNKTDVDKVILVGGSTRIPYVQQLLQDFGKELLKGIGVDEVVAYGAAVIAATLSADWFSRHSSPNSSF